MILALILSKARKRYLITLAMARGEQENRFGAVTGSCVCRMSMKCEYVLKGKCYCPFQACCVVRERRFPNLKTGDPPVSMRTIRSNHRVSESVRGGTDVVSHHHLFSVTNTKAVSALKVRTCGEIFNGTFRITRLSPYQLPESFVAAKDSRCEYIKIKQGTGQSFRMYCRQLGHYHSRIRVEFRIRTL